METPLSDDQVWGEPAPAKPIVPAPVIDDPTQLSIRREMRELQTNQLSSGPRSTIIMSVTCPCGYELDVRQAYKCLFCGIWFCETCAHRHFAQPECCTEGL